jgi:phosphoglycerate kinase
MKKELENFASVIENPKRPFTVIVGGAKVKDKIPLIKNLLNKVDRIIITGGMAFTFLKVAENVEIGKSLFDKESTEHVLEIMKLAKEKNVQVLLPEDFIITNDIKDTDSSKTKIIDKSAGIPSDKMGIDVGPKTIEKFHKAIIDSKTIFLNGSNGVFENPIGRNGSVKLIEVN